VLIQIFSFWFEYKKELLVVHWNC